jgi:hypothetical protein
MLEVKIHRLEIMIYNETKSITYEVRMTLQLT